MWGHRILLALALLMPLAGARADTWYKIDTPTFTLFSNERKNITEYIALDLLKFQFAFGQLTGTDYFALSDIYPKPHIYIFRSDGSFEAFVGDGKWSSYGRPPVVGSANLSFIPQWQGQRYVNDPLTGPFMMHAFTRAMLDRYEEQTFPLWYQSGRAEYFSTMTIDRRGIVTVGLIPAARKATVSAGQQLTFAELINSNVRTLSRNDAPQAYYSAAWLFAAFTFDKPNYRAFAAELASRQMIDDRNTTELWELIAGESVDATNAKLLNFSKTVQGRKGKGFRLDASLQQLGFKAPVLKFEPLDEGERAAIAIPLKLRSVSSLEEHQSICREYAERNTQLGNQTELTVALFDYCRGAVDLNQRQSWFSILRDTEPDSSRRYSMEASLLLEQAQQTRDTSQKKNLLDQLRRASTNAVKRNRLNVQALHTFAESFLVDDQVTETGVKVARSAASLVPADRDLQKGLTLILMRAGRLDEADKEIRRLIYWSILEDEYEDALDMRMHLTAASSFASKQDENPADTGN